MLSSAALVRNSQCDWSQAVNVYIMSHGTEHNLINLCADVPIVPDVSKSSCKIHTHSSWLVAKQWLVIAGC